MRLLELLQDQRQPPHKLVCVHSLSLLDLYQVNFTIYNNQLKKKKKKKQKKTNNNQK